jgi:D-alanyl-D-alanine dipeptidase
MAPLSQVLEPPANPERFKDPSSPFYNTITKRSDIGTVKADDMGSAPLYRRGLFVEYPSDRAGRRGSCIFIHIWSAPDVGTAGCIGLPEARVRTLQEFAQAGAVIAVLPESALDRFAECLPATMMRPAAGSMEPLTKRPAAPSITVPAGPGGSKGPKKAF